MSISFLLNGNQVTLDDTSPTTTVLDWLRDTRGLTGTKEGCNEGDCGACTVMVGDDSGWRAANACILFLPQLDGRALRTVEGLSRKDGDLHPVQQAMIDHHGSQCGFCTPGFVMSMAAAHAEDRTDHDDVLAGNLCRCTGYAPIIRAAHAAQGTPKPDWVANDLKARPQGAPPNLAEFADWYADAPDATLIAGNTDVGLWVTKGMHDLGKVGFLGRIPELRQIEITPKGLRIGAAVTVAEVEAQVPHIPALAELLRRYGSTQVRNSATLCGNIANGSPIGDSPPALIALGATLRLRRRDKTRDMPLEAFFIAYGKQDRQPGEFVESVLIPPGGADLACYKISKRFDQDISALCGCFNIAVSDGMVTTARIAFGGMDAIPRRAAGTEAALLGQPWTKETIAKAATALHADFTPISDMRASAAYRAEVAANLLWRLWEDRNGTATSVLEVQP